MKLCSTKAAGLAMMVVMGWSARAEPFQPPAEVASGSDSKAKATLEPAAASPAKEQPDPSSVRIVKGSDPSKTSADSKFLPKRPEPALEERNWGEAFYDILIKGRLSLGVRRTSFKFEDTLRPEDETRTETYIGYVNELIPESDSSVGLLVGYEILSLKLHDWVSTAVAVDYSRDEVSSRTLNFNNNESDGVVKMSGPIYGITLRLSIMEVLCPYVGIGYAPWKAEFEHEEWWNLGYDSPEHYNKQGRPGTPLHGYRRIIEVEDDTCRFYTYGLAVRIHRNVELDLMMRQVELTSQAAFYKEYNGTPYLSRTGAFPLDHKSYGIAMKVVF